jgi:hypothetical protein
MLVVCVACLLTCAPGHDFVDIFKVDIEGAEFEAFVCLPIMVA